MYVYIYIYIGCQRHHEVLRLVLGVGVRLHEGRPGRDGRAAHGPRAPLEVLRNSNVNNNAYAVLIFVIMI